MRLFRSSTAFPAAFFCLAVFCAVWTRPVQAQLLTDPQATTVSASVPVNLTADRLDHDEASGAVTASGHVELVQGARPLRADAVTYNRKTGAVTAVGNVSLLDENGDVHFADDVHLEEGMRNGFIRGLKTYLATGGHFTAEEGERTDGKLLTMYNASYTPCECETDEDGDPAWRIRADEVVLDEEAHKIRYKNARFEIFGVPVAFTPFLTHPDGKEKRKSGFIAPQVGYDSQLGVVVTQNYYWDIAPDRDATVGAMLTTHEAPVALVQYRRRFNHARMQAEGSATYSSRNDSIGGREVLTDNEARGHLFADSLWDINGKWRAGLDLELTSDDQYLRQYDFSGKDVLENALYVERFSGRNYAVGRLLAFQDVRVEEKKTDQPNVLPEIIVDFKGDSNALLGGRWETQASLLELQRNQGQDVTRLVGSAGWQRRHVSRIGLVNTLDLSVRGDAYRVNDRDPSTGATVSGGGGTDTRLIPQAHLVTRYPFVKALESVPAQVLLEPVAALTAAPDIDDVTNAIPNEDSQDVQLDASNLFEPNRFPGLDRLEDRAHATYGIRTGLYGTQGSYGDVFVGQSYRFSKKDNPFPAGSGLERQESDWVGQVAGMYDGRYGMNYRFQLNGRNLTARRHEFDGFADFGRLDLNARYLFADSLDGTDIVESREQAYAATAYELTRHWRVRGSALQDLGENPGLRKATFGVDYFGCCLSFSATVERNNTSDVSGDSGTDVMFRIGLKGLGEFESAPGGTFGAQTGAAPQ